jgi:hypothetical protein
MSLMLPVIGMFVFIGLTQQTVSRRIYVRMALVVLVVALVYYFRAP